jgi:hypothetical protein
MNRLVRSLLVASATFGLLGQSVEARSRLQSIVEVRPINLTEETPFWRDGKQLTARDTVLIRVKVADTSAFIPTGIGPPLFVFGDVVCLMLRGPATTGEAVLLAPRTPANQPTLLWLTERGALAQKLTTERVRILRARAQQDGLQVPALSADARSTQHRNISELIESIR